MSSRRICLMGLLLCLMVSRSWGLQLFHDLSDSFGDNHPQVSLAVATDAAGNSIITGKFEGTVDFGGGALTSTSAFDIFIAKFDSSGNHVWSDSYGGIGEDNGTSVAVDALGNVIVTGQFEQSVDFGGGTLTSAGGLDIFLVKLDPSGAHIWSDHYGNDLNQWSLDVAVGASNEIALTGYFKGTVNFGGGDLTASGTGTEDVFVARFDASGVHSWSDSYGDGDRQLARSVAIDGSGNLAITGRFEGIIDFGAGADTSAGSWDIFVAEFDSAGALLWSDGFGDVNQQFGQSVAFDGSGNVIVTGYMEGTVDFGGGGLSSAGGTDLFLAMFDGAGSHTWSRHFGDAANQLGQCVEVDGSGNIMVTGDFGGSLDFDGRVLTSAGGGDVFLVVLDDAGVSLWSQGFGDASPQYGTGATFASSGAVLATGYFEGSMDFGGGSLTSAGSSDIYLAKFIPGDLAIHYVTPTGAGAQDGSSWGNASDLQSALGAANAGDQIWVAAGTHKPGVDRTDTFSLRNEISIYGGFAGSEISWEERDVVGNVAVLSGDVDVSGVNDSYHVVTADSVDSTAVLDGVTISFGRAKGGSGMEQGRGGGIYIRASSPTLSSLIISDNTSASSGGGIYSDDSSIPRLKNVSFESNTAGPAGGGMFCYFAFLEDVVFIDNFSGDFGGGIFMAGGLVKNAKFCFNRSMGGFQQGYGGGIYITGGAYIPAANVSISNTIFYKNTASTGGGGLASDGNDTLSVLNSSFFGNVGQGEEGGAIFSNSYLRLENVILWGDTNKVGDIPSHPEYDEVYCSWGTVSYSIVMGGLPPEPLLIDLGGNLSIDPFYADPAIGDLRLISTSPAIDAGDSTVSNLPSTDIDGNPRVQNVTVDMGAYENYYNTSMGSGVSVSPIDETTGTTPVTVTYSEVTQFGTTTLITTSTAPPPPGGFTFGDMSTFYDLSTTAEYSGPIEICIEYDDTSLPGPESSLDLMHYDESLIPPAWVVVTSSRDTVLNILCGIDSSLSPFGIAFQDEITGVGEEGAPEALALHQNVPNPFNPATTIRYDVPAPGTRVRLLVYDVRGALVRRLVDEWKKGGVYEESWDGRNGRGVRVASGIYFYRLTSGSESITKKMVLVK